MKKILALFFISTILISSLHFGELLKLPEFCKHYSEHKHSDPSMSFFSFLTIHYMKGDVKDNDYQEDQKLPFKTLICNSCASTLYVPVQLAHNVILPIKTYEKPTAARYLHPPLKTVLSLIWQPPKYC